MEKLRVFDEGLVREDGSSQNNCNGSKTTNKQNGCMDIAASNIPVLLRTFTSVQIGYLHGQRAVDAMESGAVTVGPDSQAQAFLSRVVHQCETQSQDEFLRLFSGTNGRLTADTLNAINRVRSLIGSVYPWDGSQGSKQPLQATAAIGENRVLGHDNSLASKQKSIRRESFMARSSLFLYQKALCHVVHAVHERTKVLSSRVAKDIMAEVEFNLSLAHAALEIVGFVHHLEDSRFSGGFPRITEKIKREKNLSEFVIALGWMQSAFAPGTGDMRQNPPMPESILTYLKIIKESVIDCHLLKEPKSSWFHYANSVNSSHYFGAKPDETHLNIATYVVQEVSRLARARVYLLVQEALEKGAKETHSADALREIQTLLGNAVWNLVDTMLSKHFDLLFGRSLTMIVICCLYCTAKLHGFRVRFSFLTRLAKQLFVCVDDETFEAVICDKVASSEASSTSETETSLASVNEYYNKVLLPVIYSYEEKTLFGATSEALRCYFNNDSN